MASKSHILIFPFMAQGHTIPLLDLSKALLRRGVKVTIITTPSNSSSTSFSISKYPQIHLKEIPFPLMDGLPMGCENVSRLPSPDHLLPFLTATKLLQEPFEKILREMSEVKDLPFCVISDSFLGWTNTSCRAFGIPRLVFHGMAAFSMAVKKSLSIRRTHKHVKLDTEPLAVKGVQLHFPLTKADLPKSLRDMDNCISQFFLEAEAGDIGSWGVIVNSFIELEQDHVASLESLYGNGARAWCVGPLLLYDQMEEKEKNGAGLMGHQQYGPSTIRAGWLDQHVEEKSIIYVSFGSEAELSKDQLDEVAYGLELSNQDFIWVVRSKKWDPPSNMFEGRGLIVRDWVDQRWVLAHHAIGGFLSHCGWNSLLESLSMGVPILAWPMKAEQHLNAKFLVEELNAGLRVPTGGYAGEEKIVRREVICEGVKELMGRERGRKARERANELGIMARRAVQVGGSSYKSLNELIGQLSDMHR